MPRLFLHCLCLVTLLSRSPVKSTVTDDEEPRRTFPSRRAIDGSRGRKYYVSGNLEDGPFDSFGSSAGQYDPFEDDTDFSDLRSNIPGEPGVDYPSYTRLPQTGFVCESQFRGYYADEAAGCQVFHVCDGSFLVSSFLCPLGSIFSQRLLTCDWWSKVDCSTTRNYHSINSQSLVSETDDDDILRRAFEMASVRAAGERIPVDTVSEKRKQDDRRHRVLNYGISSVTQRGINDLQSGPDNYSDYPDYPSRGVSSRYKTSGQQLPNRQRYQEDDYYSRDLEDDGPKRNDNPKIRVHTIGDDRENDRRDSFGNNHQASYAPTVPTVTTTARRFYSPTIPTTPRSSTLSREPSRYDLEVESSDHLYTARGRSDETIESVTPPSVIVKNVATTNNISLPMLVNSATEAKEENIEESESSNRKTVTLPDLGANLTKIEASIEEIIANDGEASENVTEALSILTIDNEDRDPAIFSYTRDDEETNLKIEVTSTPETSVNSTEASNLSSASGDINLAEFLESPQKQESEFRIMVLEASSSPASKIVGETKREEKSLKVNSTSAAGTRVDVPPTHVIPVSAPVLVNEKESRESRIIRIFVNNNETSGSSSSDSITPQTSSIEKTEEAATVGQPSGISTAVPSYDATPDAISKFDNPRSIDDKNFVVLVANEESIFNATTTVTPVETTFSSTLSEDKEVGDHELSRRSEETPARRVENIGDAVNAGSSPIEVTLTVNKDEELDPNGDVIRRLIAQREVGDSIGAADYKNFEIVKSEEPGALVEAPEEQIASSDAVTNLRNDIRINDEREGRKITEERLHNYHTNSLHSTDYHRNIVSLGNGPNAPRPFSLGTQQNVENVEIKSPSDLNDGEASTSSPFVTGTSRNEIATVITGIPGQTTRQAIVSSSQEPERLEKLFSITEVTRDEGVLEQSRQTFDEHKTGKQKFIFELPHPQRSLDFETGFSRHDGKQATAFGDEVVDDFKVMEKSAEELYAKTAVETEVIPSLGFSLNTEEEREEYMEAVMKGLLHDVRATEKTKNDTETSAAS